jgi:hypothetical protein
MPLVKQRGLLLMGNFSFQVNSKIHHDMWFNNAPWGPADSWANGFLTLGQKAGGKTVALLSSNQEFAQNIVTTARDVTKKIGLQVVFDQAYPPSTAEFSSIIRALNAAKPDIVFVASYPPDSAAILRDRCSTASSITTLGCRNRACISTAPRSSSKNTPNVPSRRRSIRSASTLRLTATPWVR